MTISTSVWSAQHPNAGRNIQHTDSPDSHVKQSLNEKPVSAHLKFYRASNLAQPLSKSQPNQVDQTV